MIFEGKFVEIVFKVNLEYKTFINNKRGEVNIHENRKGNQWNDRECSVMVGNFLKFFQSWESNSIHINVALKVKR